MSGSLVAPTILLTKPSRLLIIKFCKAANYCHDEVVTTRKLSTNTSMLHTQERLKILSISLIIKTTTTMIIVTCNLLRWWWIFSFVVSSIIGLPVAPNFGMSFLYQKKTKWWTGHPEGITCPTPPTMEPIFARRGWVI